MARKLVRKSDLIESFSEFKEFKNIDRPTLMRVLEDVFRTLLRRQYGSDENFDVIVNTDKGDLEIWRRREIVPDGEVYDDNKEVAYSDAIKIESDFEIGEEVYEEIKLFSFGRRQVLAARQTLIARILELEKDELIKKYSERVGEIINGEVHQMWKREILVLDDEGNELILPRNEQIRNDRLKKGDTVRAVVKKVEIRNNNNPKIILSRTANSFLAKLLELEVPEIFDGQISIRRIAREPGERAKVAVESFDDRIDPVGACVGMRGSRITGIVRELQNENIDIINFTQNTRLFIQRALTPARISYMELNEEDGRASVYLKPEEVSKAIGRGGINIRLASKLTGFEIDVFREIEEEEEFDIELQEFTDEIDLWIIEELRGVGCDTAKSVLDLGMDELMRRSDLEEETLNYVLDVLEREFDEEY